MSVNEFIDDENFKIFFFNEIMWTVSDKAIIELMLWLNFSWSIEVEKSVRIWSTLHDLRSHNTTRPEEYPAIVWELLRTSIEVTNPVTFFEGFNTLALVSK